MNSKYSIFIATLISACSLQTFAGNIEFYEKNNAGGKRVGTLSDTIDKSMNLKKQSGWDNDKIRSIRLNDVAQGTKIRLYDDPAGSEKDDWTEITVTASKANATISHLELGGGSISYQTGYNLTWHKHNGLNGKVSHIQVIAPKVTIQPALLQDQIIKNIGSTSYYWNDKNGTAHHFVSNDAEYRFYQPKVTSQSNERVTVEFTLDHDRAGTEDDHIVVTLPYDMKTKKLISEDVKMSLKLGDEKWHQFATDIADLATNASDSRVAAAAHLAKLTGDIYMGIVGIEHGGRENFMSVVQHKSIVVSNAVFDALK